MNFCIVNIVCFINMTFLIIYFTFLNAKVEWVIEWIIHVFDIIGFEIHFFWYIYHSLLDDTLNLTSGDIWAFLISSIPVTLMLLEYNLTPSHLAGSTIWKAKFLILLPLLPFSCVYFFSTTTICFSLITLVWSVPIGINILDQIENDNEDWLKYPDDDD